MPLVDAVGREQDKNLEENYSGWLSGKSKDMSREWKYQFGQNDVSKTGIRKVTLSARILSV